MKSEGVSQSRGCSPNASMAVKCMDMRMEKALCDFQAVVSQCMMQCMMNHSKNSMSMNESMMSNMNSLMGMMKSCMDSKCMDESMTKSMSDLMGMMAKCMGFEVHGSTYDENDERSPDDDIHADGLDVFRVKMYGINMY